MSYLLLKYYIVEVDLGRRITSRVGIRRKAQSRLTLVPEFWVNDFTLVMTLKKLAWSPPS